MVAGWAKDFDAEAVFADEKSAVIAHLPTIDGEGAEEEEGAGAAPRGRREFFQLESIGEAKVRSGGGGKVQRRGGRGG